MVMVRASICAAVPTPFLTGISSICPFCMTSTVDSVAFCSYRSMLLLVGSFAHFAVSRLLTRARSLCHSLPVRYISHSAALMFMKAPHNKDTQSHHYSNLQPPTTYQDFAHRNNRIFNLLTILLRVFNTELIYNLHTLSKF